jgi:hypothetical protein
VKRPATVRIDELVLDERTSAAAAQVEVARIVAASAPAFGQRTGKVAVEVSRAIERSVRP